MTEVSADALAATRQFYTRLGRGYDRLARSGFVRPYRERLADAVALAPGETVVDVGTGTGANLPILRDRVGPDGTVIGYAVQTRQFDGPGRYVNPVYVSAGHRTSAETAARLALGLTASYKLPEPVRQADAYADEVKRSR